MNISKVYIASDHAGYEAKIETKNILESMGLCVVDLGANSSIDSVDYPDFATLMANNLKNSDEVGVLICGSGIGISIAANRFSHIRCALCYNSTLARLSREHNDANVLCFGARVVGRDIIKDMVEVFFATEFSGGRHEKRVEKLGAF